MARTKSRANAIVSSGWNEAGTEMWFQVKNHKRFTFDLTTVHADCDERARLSGWEDRIIDAAAVPKSDKDGYLIPEKVRFDTMDARMRALVKHYQTGTPQWSTRAESVPDMRDEWVKQAVAQVLKWEIGAELDDKLAKLAEKRRESVGKVLEYFRTKEGAVKEAYVKIRDAAETAEGDAQDLLAELEGL